MDALPSMSSSLLDHLASAPNQLTDSSSYITISDYMSGDSLTTEDTSQRCASDDSLVEVRSCGQVDNGTPSTSPPNWDTDVDDEDCGPKPFALYEKYTRKIKKFFRSIKRNSVVMHLKLVVISGWSHFAQFTIAVVNKDPKKSKYSLSQSINGNTLKHQINNSIGAQQQATPANNNACNAAAKLRFRAQSGQATDPRSIAERPRREKIAERIKNL